MSTKEFGFRDLPLPELKGALDNILKFLFRLNFIYHVKLIANLQIQKEKFKNSF